MSTSMAVKLWSTSMDTSASRALSRSFLFAFIFVFSTATLVLSISSSREAFGLSDALIFRERELPDTTRPLCLSRCRFLIRAFSSTNWETLLRMSTKLVCPSAVANGLPSEKGATGGAGLIEESELRGRTRRNATVLDGGFRDPLAYFDDASGEDRTSGKKKVDWDVL